MTHSLPVSINMSLSAIIKSRGACPIPSYVSLAYNIQLRSGCRASEVLALKWRDIDTAGNVYIKSTKRGVPHIIRMPDLSSQFEASRGDDTSLVIPISYKQLYLGYQRIGIGVKPHSHLRNAAITHAPRHQLANAYNNLAAMDPTAASHALGHKSQLSINYYLIKEDHGETT